ncbi:MAG: VWA domain-containing protein [Planctomycetota bacterium]|nr:MAG: VWA domain-containing protein [Planctomycetota bacterium]
MFDYHLAFDRPYYLLLLALVPAVWWMGRRSLAGLGRWRRTFALTVRSLLVVLIVGALAEVQLVRTSDRVTVLYLVDRSLSVPSEKTASLVNYIRRSAAEHQDRGREDRSGVIVFGREAAVESPPLAGDTHLPARFESPVDAEATNLAAALRLAQAVFPADAAKRVVIISDGKQNVGDAVAQAQQLADLGVGIDVLPVSRAGLREVSVEKVVLPSDIRQSTPFEGRVVLNNVALDGEPGPVSGRLRISRTAGGQTQTLADRPLTVAAGKQVFSFQEEIETPDFYTYSARFVPDDAAADTHLQNNEATAFTHVRGRGQVLLVEDWSNEGQFDELVDLLGRQNLSVVKQPSNRMFSSLAELQRFDLVILADVARASGDDANHLTQISDEQIDILVRNTQNMGAGLLMIGGPNSFGAGGWTNTALEKAMPVDFQVKNAKVLPSGGLMLVIDSSGSMSGEKLELSKAAAMAAVRVLSRDDYVGVVTFDSTSHWIQQPVKIDAVDQINRRIARIDSGGGTDMQPGMIEGYRGLRQIPAAVKHMIVLTDGQTHGAGFTQMARAARNEKITTSCVAVGAGAATQLLSAIAQAGGGKYYAVDNPRMIPRIFMKEAMRVARPVIYEKRGIMPQRIASHEILDGISGEFPSISGFVMTSPKENPLVEIPLLSPEPSGNRNALLATWRYGLGRSVAFTTDAGQRWTKNWPQWSGYEKLFSQMARWTMRPTNEQGSLNVFADVESGEVQVVVTALDSDDEFVNFLDLGATLIGPDLEPVDLKLEQTAPGRYVGTAPATSSGSYFLSVAAGPTQAPVRAGINVPYSDEFKDHAGNPQLLRSLAALRPEGGIAGRVLPEPTSADDLDASLQANVFRHDLKRATSRQDSWHLLVFAAGCLFLFDVFNRRVLVSFGWVPVVARRVGGVLFRRRSEPAVEESLGRLAATKSQMDREFEDRRAAARFEPEPAATAELADEAVAVATQPRPRQAASSESGLAPQAEEDDYTTRLLKAKKRALGNRRSHED